jgi:molybdenum cofactor cytidylyltransferase
MFSVADQPLLTAETIGRLVQLHQQCHQNIVQPHINGKPANPVIFPSDLRNELAALTNGSGGRELIHRHVDRVQTLFCSAVEEFHDIDTQEDYHQLVKKWQQMS